MPSLRCPIAAGIALALFAGAGAAPRAAEIRYNRDIRPLLSDNCFQCHGPDKNQRKAKLRLDDRDTAIERGVLVPGPGGESELVKRVFSTDPEEVMPPPDSLKKLDDAQKDLLKRWIAAGAPYEAHWAYLPIERPPVPARADSGSLPTQPVDAFIGARLASVGLEAAAEADRRTLLRRLSLDLTGLPPTPREVEDFARDDSSGAYERQVERLLASPHFGERMAVPWLDAVRFTDTVGYHGDQNQRIFPYRDYVIGAFNANKPFDEFTVEQIAGDLLPEPTDEQRVATGCNRLNMMTREGGAQPKEYLAKYQADRVRTVATTWLGATMACCECHDHKFDPFTMRDFYSLSAFFADVQQWGVYNDYDYTPNPDLKGWSNDHPFPPELEVESPYLRSRIARLRHERLELARAAIGGADSIEAQGGWAREAAAFLQRNPGGWQAAELARATRIERTNEAPAEVSLEGDGVWRFENESVSTDRLELAVPRGTIAALRIELLPDIDRTNRVLRGGMDSTVIEVSAVLRPAAGGERKLSFRFAEANFKAPFYANGQDLLGVHRGWKIRSDRLTEPHDSVWQMDEPVRVASRDRIVLTLANHAAARLKVSVSPLAPELERGDPNAGYARFAGRLPAGDELAVLHLRSTASDREASKRLRDLDREIHECRDGRAWTLITAATNALVTRVLPRGNWMDETGAMVEPGTPHFLPTEPEGRRLTRLDLAEWLVSTRNPLTARNFANRLWAQFFGTGISARLEDLGLQGEWPTHPELLDWLAAEFMQPSVDTGDGVPAGKPHRWDVKHLVRVIVLSRAYRQDTAPSSRAGDIDPLNRLLSHQNPRRLEAEFVRDNALAAAGLLNLDIGGPSVLPYQPGGYYSNLQFPDRDYIANRDERQYRRGIYMHWQRTFLHPMLANFDAQSREECVAARIVSNTPQQALTLLNDPTFVEAARVFAAHAIEAGRTEAERMDFLYQRAVARAPRRAEAASLREFLSSQLAHYRANPDEARKLVRTGNVPVSTESPVAELAAWANVARVVLNLHETMTRY